MSRFGFFLAVLLCAAPAFAGTLNYSNGRGAWQSTSCQRPVAPAFAGMGGETSASSMNIAAASYNKFAADTQAYIECLTNEAQQDSKMSGDVTMMSLQKQMQDATDEVSRAHTQLFGK
jgi:hypothetical protein